MRQARDTFLHFLSDNLAAGTVVHNLRLDPNYQDAWLLQMNAVNVQFLTDSPRARMSDLTVTVDVIADSELDAVTMATNVFLLLSQSGTTPILDYTNQSLPPVSLGSNLFWDTEAVRFRPVYGETYFRHSALLTLSYHLYQAYIAP